MKTFEIKTWLGENREVVIEKYNKLTEENFFRGISLKDFMLEILKRMQAYKSEKRAVKMLPFVMGDIYYNNSKIQNNGLDAKFTAQYKGTAYMAMV